MNTEELKQKAMAATPGPWFDDAGAIRTNEVQYVKPIAIVYSLRNSVFIAAANPSAILELIRQRDELLVALKDARELVNDWGAYASAYMQEKHDLAGDIERLDAAISKVEK